MTSLHRYVSRRVLAVLSSQAEVDQLNAHIAKSKPFLQDAFGTVVMIDVCGYSNLTSSLAPLGKLSSEVLTRTIGSYIGQIVDLVYEFEGDVVKFLGDAVLASFSGHDPHSDTTEIAHRAFSCCEAILTQCPRVQYDITPELALLNASKTAATSVFELSLHIGIVSGFISHLIMGTKNRLDYSISGDCLKELSVLLDSTREGELGVDGVTMNLLESYKFGSLYKMKYLGDNVVFSLDLEPSSKFQLQLGTQQTKSKSKIPSAQITPANISNLSKFVNQSLAKKLLAQGNHSDGVFDEEFRLVSIVFVHIKLDSLLLSQQALEIFLHCLDKFNGVFQQFSVDDKGQTMFACVGLPPFSHPNNADVAVRIAIEFSKQVQSIGAADVSVATGELLFTSIGTESRSEAALLGDVVTVAARLLSVDSEDFRVICDDATYKMVSEQMKTSFSSFGDVKVKGKISALTIWGIGEESLTRKHDYVCFGYKAEREQLFSAIRQWHKDKCRQIVVLEGASGMGKSQLAQFALSMLKKYRSQHCLYQASEVDQTSPLSGIGPILFDIWMASSRTLRDTDKSLRRKSIYNSLKQRFNRATSSMSFGEKANPASDIKLVMELFEDHGIPPTYAPLLRDLYHWIRVEENETTKAMTSMARQQVLENAIFDIICGYSAKKGLAIILDDAQWVDSSTLQMLGRIAKRAERICFLVFSRPLKDYKLDVLMELKKLPVSTFMTLKGLSMEDVKNWVIDNFRAHNVVSISPAIVEEIHNRGLGSPLLTNLILESLHAFNSSLVKVNRAGCLKFAPGITSFGESLADTATRAITMQFDKLNPNFQHLLRVASVLGQNFCLTHVRDTLEFDTKTYYSITELVNLIQKSDTFNFLVEPDNNEEGNGELHYYFRHVSTCATIYESLPHSKRIELHSIITDLIEASTSEDELHSKVPILSYHSMRSSNVAKAVKYTEELALLYHDKGMFSDCIKTFLGLIEYVDRNHAQLEKERKEGRLNVSKDRRAYWLGILSWAYANWQLPLQARNASLNTFDLLGINFPNESKAVRSLIVKGIRRQFALWWQTKGGRIRLRSTKGTTMSHFANIAISKALFSLVYIASFDPTQQPGETALALIQLLNHQITLAADKPQDWLLACCRASHILTNASLSLYKIYWRKTVNVLDEMEKAKDQSIGQALMFAGFSAACRADITQAKSFLMKATEMLVNNGDTTLAFSCRASLAIFSAFSCEFEYLYDILIPERDKLDNLDATYKRVVPFLQTMHCLMRGDLTNALTFGIEFEAGLNHSQKNPFFVPITATACFYSCAIRDCEMAMQHFLNLGDILLSVGRRYMLVSVASAALAGFLVCLMQDRMIERWQAIKFQRWKNHNKSHDTSKDWRTLIIDMARQIQKWFRARRKIIRIAPPAIVMIEAGINHMSGDTEKAAKTLIHGLRLKQNRGGLGILPLFEAIYFGMIARYSQNNAHEKTYYGKMACDIFQRSDCTFMMQWVNSNE